MVVLKQYIREFTFLYTSFLGGAGACITSPNKLAVSRPMIQSLTYDHQHFPLGHDCNSHSHFLNPLVVVREAIVDGLE